MERISPKTRKAAKYFVAGQGFATKKALQDFIKGILYRVPVGSRLCPADELVMLDLLTRHPHATEKIGGGIAKIRVVWNPLYPRQRSFWLERHDGTSTDFSYLQCIFPSTHWQDLTWAFRAAIAEQILERKQRVFGGRTIYRCPITTQRCSWDDVHVDHRPPLTFARLVKDFLHAHALNPADIVLTDGDGNIGSTIVDAQLVRAWQDYHRMFADLWVISIQAHVDVTRARLHTEEKPE
jgi:uncharacterized protein DUF3223